MEIKLRFWLYLAGTTICRISGRFTDSTSLASLAVYLIGCTLIMFYGMQCVKDRAYGFKKAEKDK
jgi:hypothetical protein